MFLGLKFNINLNFLPTSPKTFKHPGSLEASTERKVVSIGEHNFWSRVTNTTMKQDGQSRLDVEEREEEDGEKEYTEEYRAALNSDGF